MDKQEKRIAKILKTNEIPSVSYETLDTYCNYIQENITCPVILTGIESMGYFSWEERFDFGVGNKEDYEQLRKERGSYEDKYRLYRFNGHVEGSWDILVKVRRIPDEKRFEIPLSELQVVGKKSANYRLLHDYSVWHVNWQY